MSFQSLEYAIFFAAVLALSWKLAVFPSLRLWTLLLASYYFYITNNHWLILLLVAETQIDYFAARLIDGTKNERARKIPQRSKICKTCPLSGKCWSR